MRARKWGRCPACGKGLVHTRSADIMEWEANWSAVAVQFECPNGHVLFLVPAAPILTSQEDARVAAAEAPHDFDGL